MMRRKPNMTLTKTPMPKQSIEQRLTNFDEVELGYTPEQAMQEAERCLNCPDRYCAAHCPAPITIFLNSSPRSVPDALTGPGNCLPAPTR